MWKFFNFIENHKFGILAAFACYVFFFIYTQMETIENSYEVPNWGRQASLEKKEIEIKPENIETEQSSDFGNGEVKSIAKDLNDSRVQSEDRWDRNKASKSVEQNVKDLEKQFYAESGESQKREKIKASADEAQQKIKSSSISQSKSKSDINSSGGNTAFKGKTMVSWELKGREPHQGNEWYVRNPGYTCGHDSNGEVYIKIKVNSSGSVLSATYLPELSRNATPCMIEQARKYALMSRFNFSQNSTSQDGKIIYTFITQ